MGSTSEICRSGEQTDFLSTAGCSFIKCQDIHGVWIPNYASNVFVVSHQENEIILPVLKWDCQRWLEILKESNVSH